ncbi:DinB family protein [Flavihumibacter fluvii]|uniref:DinB family protein n=1 Tax=Flavihumibacter fluvii TaxID=2838157 RepID=UPI001BDE1B0E|nr:DUF1572 family protein [Flavihumibacter fluvii]ULQ53092.1 DUF1572 domain-containing protein [Flavihumibacter fluvii]
MLIDILRTMFRRDLKKLKSELESYNQEENIWRCERGITNSGGNLCLHLIGNLNTYIGAEMGKTSYVRNRDAEFSLKDIPREVLLKSIDDTIEVVDKALQLLTVEDLDKEYPQVVFEKGMTVEYFLVHLAVHLSYHLGQINYHRRLLDVATSPA